MDARVRRIPTAQEVEITPTGAIVPEPAEDWDQRVLDYWAAYTTSAAAPAFTNSDWAEAYLRFLGLDMVLKASKFSHYAWKDALDGIASIEKSVIARHAKGYTGKSRTEGDKLTMEELKELVRNQ